MTSEPTTLALSPDSSMDQRSYERAVTIVTALGHILCHMGMTIFPGVLIALRSEFVLQSHHVTALALLGYMLMGLGALPVGWWVDRKGPTQVLSIYFALMAGAALILTFTTGTFHLFVGLTLLGLAASIYHPAGIAMISLHIRDRGRALGINGVAGNIGIAGGPAIGMLAVQLGVWRMAYAFLAVISVISMVIMIRVMRAQQPETGTEADNELHPNQTLNNAPKNWKRFLPIIFLLAAMTLAGFNYRSLLTGLPVYVSGETTLKTGVAKYTDASFVFFALLIGGFGQYFGGALVSRFGGGVYAILLACLIPTAVLLGLFEGTSISILFVGILAVFLFALQPVENLLLAEWTSKERRGISYGTKFALTFGLGAIGTQFVGAVLTGYQCVAPVFYGIAISATLMIGLIFLALHFRRSQTTGPA